MDELQTLLADSAARLFRELDDLARDHSGEFNVSAWEQIEELGFPLLMVPEAAGVLERVGMTSALHWLHRDTMASRPYLRSCVSKRPVVRRRPRP